MCVDYGLCLDCEKALHEFCLFAEGRQQEKVAMRYLFVPPRSPYRSLISVTPSMCGCSVGDYIAMGFDFGIGKKNDKFTKVHEFFLALKKGDRYFVKKGVKVRWAADFILLDLPCGGISE